MEIGNNIKKYRLEKSMTQKDLADQLFVTYQAVSRWENNEVEPGLDMIKRMCQIFECELNDLVYGEDEQKPESKPEVEVEPGVVVPEPITKTIIIHQKEMHVCHRCKKDIPENELEIDHVCVSHGGRGRHAEYRDVYYHKKCLIEQREENAKLEKAAKTERGKRKKKMCLGWGIAAGVIGLGASLGIFLGVPELQAAVHPALAVLYSVLIGYGLFAMLYCILSGSYIGDVFVWAAGLSIKFPGLIFTWDIEGIIWVIAMKIFFMILAFIIGVAAFIFAIGLSAALAAVSFPFILVHNINTEYEDAF